jgi:hypothetical protein
MSNAIDYAISRVYREVPEALLALAFGTNQWGYHTDRTSLDYTIRSEVIGKIVMVDCNIVGGEVITVPLVHAAWTYMEQGVRIEIPLSQTHGRLISSVLSLEIVNRGVEPYAISDGVPGFTGTPEVYLVAPNTIFVPVNPQNQNSHLRCTIVNDANLSNFNQKALLDFGDLAVVATKGYIFNKLSINMSITANTGGLVDGRMRSLVDDYADSWEIYRDILRIRWKKISIMADRETHMRYITMGLPK